MIRPGDIQLAADLRQKLISFDTEIPLLGIQEPARMECLIEQMVDSVRRIKYITTLTEKNISVACINPLNDVYDPLKAAIFHKSNGNLNEAFWLIFLVTHFGKNKKSGWELLRNVYGKLQQNEKWDWETVVRNPVAFSLWIHDNMYQLRNTGSFGNHRKYESLKCSKTGATILSYMEWIGEDHNMKFNALLNDAEDSKFGRFQQLNKSMTVYRFGRTARFDYLTMCGKLALLDIAPDSVYIHGATGPYEGGCLLFNNQPSGIDRSVLNSMLEILYYKLDLYFGMQVLEDSLCNWQKSPEQYNHFTG
jgi:hypothetical protein